MPNKKKMFIVGGNTSYYGPFIPFYELISSEKDFFKHHSEVDLILFTGGADVDPMLYEEESPLYASTNWTRDQDETSVFDLGLRNKIKMCGICRGMQLLNIMSGGRMIHHISGHPDNHKMYSYKGNVEVNSLHHQVCIPSRNSLVIGWSDITGKERYYGNYDKELKSWPGLITEALLFPSLNAYGVQYHPEMLNSSSPGYNWFSDLVEDFVEDDVKTKKLLDKWSHHYRIVFEETKEKNRAFCSNK